MPTIYRFLANITLVSTYHIGRRRLNSSVSWSRKEQGLRVDDERKTERVAT